MIVALALVLAADEAPAQPEPPVLTSLQQASILVDTGRALEATALLLREERAGHVEDGAAAVAVRAAEALATAGDNKAAALAADAGWRWAPTTTSPRAAQLVVRYARAIEDNDPGGAKALAARALVIDPDNADATALIAELDGFDSWTVGHVVVGSGVGLAALSATAFVTGFDVERQLRATVHDTATVDGLLLQRGLAAGVAWPSAVSAVVATGLGLALILRHEEPVVATLPSSFPPLPTTTVSTASMASMASTATLETTSTATLASTPTRGAP